MTLTKDSAMKFLSPFVNFLPSSFCSASCFFFNGARASSQAFRSSRFFALIVSIVVVLSSSDILDRSTPSSSTSPPSNRRPFPLPWNLRFRAAWRIGMLLSDPEDSDASDSAEREDNSDSVSWEPSNSDSPSLEDGVGSLGESREDGVAAPRSARARSVKAISLVEALIAEHVLSAARATATLRARPLPFLAG